MGDEELIVDWELVWIELEKELEIELALLSICQSNKDTE